MYSFNLKNILNFKLILTGICHSILVNVMNVKFKIQNIKKYINKLKVLLNIFPFEICEKIIKMTYKYSKCINCQKTLCESHIHIGHEPKVFLEQ